MKIRCVSAAYSAATACRNTRPCGLSRTTRDSLSRSASTASKIGSGFITIPCPPPYGTSSVVRCLSRAQSRRLCTRMRAAPDSWARFIMLAVNAPSHRAGNNVRMSISSMCSGTGRRATGATEHKSGTSLVDPAVQGRRDEVIITKESASVPVLCSTISNATPPALPRAAARPADCGSRGWCAPVCRSLCPLPSAAAPTGNSACRRAPRRAARALRDGRSTDRRHIRGTLMKRFPPRSSATGKDIRRSGNRRRGFSRRAGRNDAPS